MTGRNASAGDRFADVVGALRWSDVGARVASIRLIQERKDSAIAEVSIVDGDGSPRALIVKRHRAASRDGRSPAELARHEFALLSTLGPSLAHASAAPELGGVVYSVPRPILLDERLSIVAMEKAGGESLERLIRQARRRAASRRLEIPLNRAATWLRLMQRQTESVGSGCELLERTVADAIETLRRVAFSDPALGARQPSIERRLQELARDVSPSSLQIVGQHGDFWPGNVFIDGDRVLVIDFEGFRDGLPLQDVAYLLWYLEQLPLASLDYPRLRRTFLDAYLAGEAVDETALALFRLIRAIDAVGWDEAAGRSPIRRLLQRSPRGVLVESAES